jgi:hypothetical protein
MSGAEPAFRIKDKGERSLDMGACDGRQSKVNSYSGDPIRHVVNLPTVVFAASAVAVNTAHILIASFLGWCVFHRRGRPARMKDSSPTPSARPSSRATGSLTLLLWRAEDPHVRHVALSDRLGIYIYQPPSIGEAPGAGNARDNMRISETPINESTPVYR